MSYIIIPHQELSPDTLHALIEEFVTRDGTDYGEVEMSLSGKTRQLYNRLSSGSAVIIYDTRTENCNIINKDDLPVDMD